MKKSLGVILSIVLFFVFVCPLVTKAAGPLTDEERTLTDNNSLNNPLPVARWTPVSKFYGLKIFWENALQIAAKLLPAKYQEKYLLHLTDERTNELTVMVNNDVKDARLMNDTIKRTTSYVKSMVKIIPKLADETIGKTLDTIAHDLGNQITGVNTWEMRRRQQAIEERQRLSKEREEDAAFQNSMNQMMLVMLAQANGMRQALDNAQKGSVENLLASKVDNKFIANYLFSWSKENQQQLMDLFKSTAIDPTIAPQAQKSADAFVERIKNIQNSNTLNQQQIKTVLDDFTNNLNNFNKQRLEQGQKLVKGTGQNQQQEAQNKIQPIKEQKVEQPKPAKPAPVINKQPPVTPPQPQPEKKTLKKIPSESVKREPLALHYGKQLFGQVNQKFAFTFTGSGGLPPYHFQLGTGGGFPPHGIVLAPSGLLSGTPTAKGDSSFSVCVVDIAGANVCAPVAMTIYPAQPEPEPEPEPETALAVTLDINHCNVVNQVTNQTGTYTFYKWWMRGTASGPVGSRVELFWADSRSSLLSMCGDWTYDIGTCIRTEGQPAMTTWTFGWPEKSESNLASTYLGASGDIRVTTRGGGNVQKLGWRPCGS